VRAPLTTHVLDTANGRPGQGVPITASHLEDGVWREITTAHTDNDGRVTTWPVALPWGPGVWRLRFAVGAWYAARGETCFFPEVDLVFEVTRPDQHHHVPLLLTPHGYTTYRGS
jgi:5-hydroxyisourate hydrolase